MRSLHKDMLENELCGVGADDTEVKRLGGGWVFENGAAHNQQSECFIPHLLNILGKSPQTLKYI